MSPSEKRRREQRPDDREVASVRHLSYALRVQINRDAAGDPLSWRIALVDTMTRTPTYFTSLPGLVTHLANIIGVPVSDAGQSGRNKS